MHNVKGAFRKFDPIKVFDSRNDETIHSSARELHEATPPFGARVGIIFALMHLRKGKEKKNEKYLARRTSIDSRSPIESNKVISQVESKLNIVDQVNSAIVELAQ